ncbi:MAG: anhydro-N-acetylmuramic acid kinase, partial [Deltaproteobacteria bacterium]|nr:anhydro-N-acetylmuramic acid kinase [Deltaproteobacteria bacterium]
MMGMLAIGYMNRFYLSYGHKFLEPYNWIMPLVIGVMSGTSCDGVDIAIAQISSQSIKLKAFEIYSYPQELKKQILNPSLLSLKEIAEINFNLGRFYGSCVKKMMNSRRLNSKKIYCIGSHGHTFFHKTVGPA